MGGVAKTPEHRVRCLAPLTKSGGDEVLRLKVDDKPVGVTVCVGQLNTQIVAGLPDRALDLLEIAALVHGADAAVSRGGLADQQMGKKWHRRLIVEMPVRELGFWQSEDVSRSLEETLMFLSGDRFEFVFSRKENPEAERNRFFRFDVESSWQAERVLMFSGGLDSYAGALEEIAEQGHRVALVSHFSATKIAPVQRGLQKELAETFGLDSCRHIPVQVQMKGGTLREGTHRSRSFLFAALGAITAEAFGLSRVSFYENGVVSLNLPPVGNVLGTRATRTTHPQTLARFTDFFGRVFNGDMRVDNPFFWRTKTEVVETIARLGRNDQIANTRSCADVHNQTTQYVHCGRCSQCIDRRFAILAAGLERFDPEEAYKVNLMTDARSSSVDREVALSYVRNARAFEHIRPDELEQHFPAVSNAVGHLDNPPDSALKMVTQLLTRHGKAVSGVMRETLRNRDAGSFPEDSLPRLYGDAEREAALPHIVFARSEEVDEPGQVLSFEVDETRRRIVIDGRINIERNATYQLLAELANAWLKGAGQGLQPLDFPLITARKLAKLLGLEHEEALRRRINRARNFLGQRFVSSGKEAHLGRAAIENIPSQGYRLAPDRVRVTRRKEG